VLLAQTIAGYELISSLITARAPAADRAAYTFYRYSCWMNAGLPVPDGPNCRVRALQDAQNRRDAHRRPRRMPPASPSFSRPHVVACELHAGRTTARNRQAVEEIARRPGCPSSPAGGVRMHERARKPLLDLMTAIA